jgi:transposase-like protein
MSVQLMTPNQRKARRLTPEQKLQILKEWEQSGNGVEMAQKHQIHPHTLYRWKKAMEQGAQTYLKGTRPKVDPEVKQLRIENQKLKETVTLLSQELMLVKKRMNLV